MEPASPEIPSGAELLNIQVAGHRFGLSKNKLGLLRHSQSGDILKPICDQRSEKEYSFYKRIFSHEFDGEQWAIELRCLVPKFNGIFVDSNMNLSYLRIADITASMVSPSLMDLKIGQKTYDPEANEKKIQAEIAKYQYVNELGFRILGLRIFDPKTQEYIIESKDYGLAITPKNVTTAFKHYVQSDRALLSGLHSQLGSIIDWFDKHNLDRWKFYSSSLLFAYGQQGPHHVKMIDFAHVFENEPSEFHYTGPHDLNYLFGLRKLDQTIKRAIDELQAVHSD